jgi:hypothetical protein
MRDVIGTLSAQERISEIAEILAAGLMRLHARKSSQLCPDAGESSLHISPVQSGYPNPDHRRTSDA